MKKIVVSMLLVLALVGTLLLCACTGDAPSGEAEMTVMSYNIRIYSLDDVGANNWGTRKSVLVQHILQTNPDIVGTQEVGRLQLLYLIEEGNLGGKYDYFGQARDTKFSVTGEGVYIFYDRARFEVVQNGVFWLAEDTSKPSKGFGGDQERMVVWGRLKDNNTGKEFFAFNTHLDTNQTARTKGVGVLLDMIAQINTDNLPLFVTGDFNFDENDNNYRTVTAQLTDSRYVANVMDSPAGTGSSHGYGKNIRTSPIDFIYLSNNSFDVSHYKIHDNTFDGIYSSDHYAVVVRLAIK